LLVACKTNNINANTNNESDTFTVGPAAESLVGPDSVEVDVPANAVSSNLQVTLSVEANGFPALPSGTASAGNVFSFEPAGQTFAAPLTVKIPYTAAGSGTPTLLTAEDGDPTWTTLSSTTVSAGAGTFLSAQTTHFSLYTVVMSSGEAGEEDASTSVDGGGSGGASSGGSSSGGSQDSGPCPSTCQGGDPCTSSLGLGICVPTGCTTSVSGIVFDSAGMNPVPNATLFIPSDPLGTVSPDGSVGDYVTVTTSDASGKFTLTGAPAGTHIPLVVQGGTSQFLPNVVACENNPLPDKSVRL
jgi:hypothetical protein